MIDVVLGMVAGGGLLAVGFALGKAHRPGAPKLSATCTCDHPLSSHDPQTNRCCEVVDWHMVRGRRVNEVCACRQYVGPRPIDSVFVPPILPEGS